MKVTDSVQAESEEKKDTVVEKEEPVTLSLTFHYEESYVQPIIEEFEKLHPNVTVEFQLNKDGDEALLTKIVGGGSTDVTLIPSIMAAEDMPQYFVELGDPEELRNKYFLWRLHAGGWKSFMDALSELFMKGLCTIRIFWIPIMKVKYQ